LRNNYKVNSSERLPAVRQDVNCQICSGTPTFQSGQGSCSAKEVSRRLVAHGSQLTDVKSKKCKIMNVKLWIM